MRRFSVVGGALLSLSLMTACTESSERRMTYIDAAIDAEVDAAAPDMAAPDMAAPDMAAPDAAADAEASDGGDTDAGEEA